MIPFLPRRRPRPDDDAHARARSLISDRLDAPLGPDEAHWLQAHLEICDACEQVADEYAAQRTLLRNLPAAEPPRDLWARTRAALEQEAEPRRAHRRPSVVPLGALSGALVVGVVVGASVLSSPGVVPAPSPSLIADGSIGPSSSPRATPIAVGAGQVGWLQKRDDGTYALAYAAVEEVCTAETRPDCAPLDPAAGTLALSNTPRAIVGSPKQDQLVVVEAATRDTGGTVYVVAAPPPDVPLPSEEPSPTPSPTPPPSAGASESPAPSDAPSPSVVPSPSPSPEPTVSPTPEPTVAPTPEPTVEPSTEPSTEPSGSPEPSTEPSVDPSTSPGPSSSPDTTAPIAIAADVIVVGESAAYSPDGQWFAFAARPADGSRGPDVFVWQPGDAEAHRVTDNGRSVFATWVGDRILGSRVVTALIDAPAGVPQPPDTAVSFLLDPETGAQETLAGGAIWRPVVDPTGRFVVYWDGAIEVDPSGLDWRPGEGRLVLAAWDPTVVAPTEPDSSQSPIASAPIPLTAGQIRDWDVRWDETGTRFALWLAEAADPAIGALTLHGLDPSTGVLDPDGAPALDGVPALAGFSIESGRLAWASPPGQDGEGSRLFVLAWNGDTSGQVESEPGPGSDPILVVR